MTGILRAGTPGDDTILSQAPRDTLVGGQGDDTYDVLHYGTIIREDVGQGHDVIVAHIDYTLPFQVEDLILEYADRGHLPIQPLRGPLVGIGNGLDNTIAGNNLDNVLKGLGGDDMLLGNGGDDSLDGGQGNDTQVGGQGNDTLIGGAGDDDLAGGLGDDLFRGEAGDDRIFGNDGLDIAIYDGDFGTGGNYQMVRAMDGTATITANNGDGIDTLSGIELIIFGTQVWLNSPPMAGPDAAGFDEALYLSRNLDVAAAVRNSTLASGRVHFETYGMQEGRDPNALFDTDYYLAQYQDVADAVARGETTAWSHYNSYGWREGRDPSAWFNTRAYIAVNEDVTAQDVNPLLHFLHTGSTEGRMAQIANNTLDWVA